MTNLKTQLRLTSLLSLILLACTAAYGQITPLGDTYTNSADPTTNYGAQKTLDVDAAKEITYIQFNLSSIPTGASVSQATLKLYVNTVATAGAFEVYAVNGTWSESTLTYSLAPALGSVIDSNVPITTADKNQYILIPMTATVQGWVNTPSTNYGIALVAVGSFNATFDSKETTTTSHPAELDVVFAGDGTITGVTTASGSGLTGGGTSGTLNLSMTNACAANQVLQWNGSAWICAAVGTGTITGVTAGTDLSGGGTSGNVTLNLNTAALNAVYAQLGAANTFTTTQTINGTVTATAAGNGVAGIATGTTGDTIGVLGTSAGSTGSGVYGIATNTAGTGAGVYGQSSSPTGYGLSGTNNATTGNPVGVFGLTSSPLGAGVFGENGATTGAAPGVIGESSSNAGFGVAGSDPNSVGVYGAGINGVLGETPSTSGSGVEGVASATTGTTFGVSGTASSPNGYGVFGANTSSAISLNGLALGVYGTTTATSGAGVEGSATATTGTTVGVFGTTSSTSGIGVLGNEEATTGSTTGVWGMASSTTGVGVFGSGATGVFGSGSASYGGKFVSEGAAALYAENNTTTAGAELFYAWMPNFPTDAAAIIGDPGCDEDSGNMALQLGQTSMSSCTNYTLVGNISGATYLNANSGQSLNLRVGNGEVV
ncbi:MAG: DNRLRE domain-containing protein, partial [Terriglobales bacterium]